MSTQTEWFIVIVAFIFLAVSVFGILADIFSSDIRREIEEEEEKEITKNK